MATDSLRQGLAELARPDGPADLAAAIGPLTGPEGARYRDLTEFNHLVAALVDALERAGSEVPDDLTFSLADDQAARLQIRRTTNMVRDALDDRVPWVVIKGPAVAAIMKRPELRTYNDLDLLVPGNHLETALDCLTEAGMVELNQNWEPYIKHRIGEIPMAGFRTTIDVHWDPVALGRTRRAISFDVAAMIDRRVSVDVAGLGPLPVLEPVDQILHLAVHCALSGATRFDQFRDLASVAQLLSDDDWGRLVQRARAVGGARLAAHALDRADLAIGVGDLPPGLVDDLGGRIPIRLRRQIDRTGLGWRRFVIENRRDGASETSRALATRALLALSRSGPGGWDFADKNSKLYYQRQSGGPEGRRRYLAMAADLTARP